MGRMPLVVAIGTLFLTLGACNERPPTYCEVAGSTLPTVDADDSVARWTELEHAADAPIREDIQALRVVAEQIVRLGDDPGIGVVAAVAVRPDVVARHARVVAYTRTACR